MRHSTKSGFTLLEVLIYTAMVGIIMMGVIMLSAIALEVRGKVRASIILQQNYRFALSRITTVVNQADDITSPVEGTSSTELILEMSEPALNPTIINSQNGVLYVKEGISDPIPLTSKEIDIQSFVVLRAGTTLPMVKIVTYGRLRNADTSYPDLTVTTTAVIRK